MKGGEREMKSLKSKIVAALGVILVGGSLLGTSQVLAETDKSSNNNPASFIEQLAQKLGISQPKVQQAVGEIKKERGLRMQANSTAILDQAVKDKKITEAQKQLILQKKQELQNHRQQLEDWAKQNSIDTKYLFGPGGGKGGF